MRDAVVEECIRGCSFSVNSSQINTLVLVSSTVYDTLSSRLNFFWLFASNQSLCLFVTSWVQQPYSAQRWLTLQHPSRGTTLTPSSCRAEMFALETLRPLVQSGVIIP